MKPRPVALLVTALLASALAAFPADAPAQQYPRLGLYGQVYGDGFPFTSTPGDLWSPLNSAVLDSISRYHEAILVASPVTEYRPDIIAQLRLRNPNISVLAYVMAEFIWDGVDQADSTVHYPTRYRQLVRNLNGYLYNRAGGKFSLANVNMAKRTGGRYVVAEGLADLFHDAIASTGDWDGIFFDIYCNSVLWAQSPAESIDFQRAGYSTLASFDAAWLAGTDTLANRLRRLVGSVFVLSGNCGQGTKYASMNGWMRENFPFQNGGNWYENMFRDPGGYFTDEARFRVPRHNYLFTWVANPNTPYDLVNAKRVRFGLASAALGTGFNVFGPSNLDSRTYPGYYHWWYDEYGVDRVTGRSSRSFAHVGWLGQALGPYYQMIWVGTNPDAVTNPGFEADVTSGWTFGNTVPATLSRDTSNPAVGTASAHIDVPAPAPFDWGVNYATNGRLSVSPGTQYAATFWARASAPRSMNVVAGVSGLAVAYATVQLTTTWKRYQVILIPNAAASVGLQFYVGNAAGHVWLDDVHFQQGATSVYRRDFQNGVVLVNPSNLQLTVPLERPLRRILGTVDPSTNNGVESTSMMVPASDALFLMGDDLIPPSAILDLVPIPPGP